jgi:hypothetical protein
VPARGWPLYVGRVAQHGTPLGEPRSDRASWHTGAGDMAAAHHARGFARIGLFARGTAAHLLSGVATTRGPERMHLRPRAAMAAGARPWSSITVARGAQSREGCLGCRVDAQRF